MKKLLLITVLLLTAAVLFACGESESTSQQTTAPLISTQPTQTTTTENISVTTIEKVPITTAELSVTTTATATTTELPITTTTLPMTTTQAPITTEPPVTEKESYRVLIASDIHNGHSWYGVSSQKRMQEFVDFVNAEHAEEPFDMMLFLGDYSLDYWISGGTVLHQNRRDTQTFMKLYVPKLPDVPMFFLAGNHEQYSNDDWKALTGNDRSGVMKLGNNVFVMLDAFSGNLDPKVDHDGVYEKLDCDAIQKAVDENPDSNIFVLSHYIDHTAESAKFRQLIKETDAIRGLFMGHKHKREVIELGPLFGNKTIAQAGNFSYAKEDACYWGIRDLIITGDMAVSRYIMAEVSSDKGQNERRVMAQVMYNADGTSTVIKDEAPPAEGGLTKANEVFAAFSKNQVNLKSSNFSKSFEAVDLREAKKLIFDITLAVDIDFDAIVCDKSQLELTSSGSYDLNEWNWDMAAVLKAIGGKHTAGETVTLTLNMADLKPETKDGDQELDLANVTYCRWYFKNLSTPFTVDIANIRFE